MTKLFITLLLFIGLSSCVTNDNLSSISDKVSNVSDKVASLVNSDKAKKNLNKVKISNQQNSFNLTKENIITYEFIEWKCDTFFGGSKVLRTGYFPFSNKDGVSLGALTLETNDEMYASFHSINGINDTFSWGGKNLNKYMLVIKPGNSGYFYDFTDAQKGEKRESQQTLKCNKEAHKLSLKEVDNYFEAFENIFIKYGYDIPQMFKK
tara:strand:- start:4 stop:627 length:624 start_codon:yes stop_codon:yes gene_type:complete